MSTMQHWEQVYRDRNFDAVSWYAPHLTESLRILEHLRLDRHSGIIDVGGGESTLVDDLLERGYRNLCVLDISATAIEFTRARLGARSGDVTWYVGDITSFDFQGRQFDVWHDRAVFHFLTSASDRRAYVEQVTRTVRRGGHVVMATFGPHGPIKCSGLDVVRYDADHLHAEFGNHFQSVGSVLANHTTPANRSQEFLYCWCRVG